MADKQYKPDPNFVCKFSLVKNTKKTEEKHPDFVLPVNADAPGGKEWKKNFTVNGVWCDAYAYIQEDGSIGITVKKNEMKAPNSSAGPKKVYANADAFMKR
jgi:hypothetical protein